MIQMTVDQMQRAWFAPKSIDSAFGMVWRMDTAGWRYVQEYNRRQAAAAYSGKLP